MTNLRLPQWTVSVPPSRGLRSANEWFRPRLNPFFQPLLVAACLVFLAQPLAAQGLPEGNPEDLGLSSDRLQRVEELITGAIEQEEIAGAVALIARRGRIAFIDAFGMADIDDREPMEVDTLFRIASMTKPVTSLAVMMLYEEGHFFLDDPISKYIPGFSDPQILAASLGNVETSASETEITIQQLLTHTSGISYRFMSDGSAREAVARLYRDAGVSDGLSETQGQIADLSDKLGGLPLLFEPGSQFAYGLSIDVLGHLVEIISGMTLAEFFHARIFQPLGMQDTHFYLEDDDVERLASVYLSSDNGGIRELGEDPVDNGYLVYSGSYPYGRSRTYFSGGAGLVSTASDYARFLQMFLNGGELEGARLLSPRTVEMMTRNSIGTLMVGPGLKFGLGFAIVEDPGVSGASMSQGSYYWGGFFNTRFFVDPSEELIGIFMSQRYPRDGGRIRDKFINVVYQAIVD